MQRRQFVVHALSRGVVAAAGVGACGITGCGTFIHSERCGQPHSNQIDWKIAALDGLGLLLFFIPGVIAFIVDFSTGAIYLPYEEAYPGYGAGEPINPAPPMEAQPAPLSQGTVSQAEVNAASAPAETGLKRIAIPREQLQDPNEIEHLVATHVGRTVSLDDGEARVSALSSLDAYGEQARRHQSDRRFGHRIRSFFERRLSV